MPTELQSSSADANEEERICARCEESWPLAKEFFFRNKHSPRGFSTTCRACIAETRDRQVAAAAVDPRLAMLRVAIKTGVLTDLRVVAVSAFFRANDVSAPDVRVLVRMLEILAEEKLIEGFRNGKRRRFRCFEHSKTESLSPAALDIAMAQLPRPRRATTTPRLSADRKRQLDIEWYLIFRRFRVAVRQNGGAMPVDYPSDPRLGTWMNTQRNLYRKHRLAAWRQRFLERIGFIWNVYDARWEEMFQELKAYHGEHGHCRIWKDSRENPALGRWVHRQRQMRAKAAAQLTRKRIERLDALGFDWDPVPGKPYGPSGWAKRKMDHGDIRGDATTSAVSTTHCGAAGDMVR